MAARGEQLDRLEAVAGDLREVVTAEPLVVVQVCRYAEAHALTVPENRMSRPVVASPDFTTDHTDYTDRLS